MHGFINWDDGVYITSNPLIEDLDFSSVRAMFTHFYVKLYVPLVFLSYSVDHAIGGLHPLPYHLQNVLWHVGTTLLAFRLMQKLGLRPMQAWVAALLFGIHPLRVESVAWITERKDVMFGFFFFAGLLSHLRYRESDQRKWYLATIACMLLSIMSKVTGVVFPAALLLVDYLQGRTLWGRKTVLEVLPFAVLSLLLVIIFISHWRTLGHYQAPMGLGEKILIAGSAMAMYAGKTFWPFELSLLYPLPKQFSDLPWAEIIIGVVVVAALTIIHFRAGKGRFAVFCLLFFAVTVAPVLQLIPVGPQIIADRYLYLGFLGFAMLTVGAAAILREKYSARLLSRLRFSGAVVCVLIGVGLCVLTVCRQAVWRTSENLWRDVLRQYPNNPTARLVFSNSLVRSNRNAEAERVLQTILRDDPAVGEAYIDLALLYHSQNRYGEAGRMIQNGFQRCPQLENSQKGLGLFLLGRIAKEDGDNDLAKKHLLDSTQYDPSESAPRKLLASLLMDAGDWEGALIQAERILDRYPHDSAALMVRADSLRNLQRWEGAVAAYQQLLRSHPGLGDARGNLAICWMMLGQTTRAETELKRALQIQPTNATLHYELGNFWLHQKDYARAIESYQTALQFHPQLASARFNLGVALAAMERITSAQEAYLETLQIKPDHLGAMANLAALYTQQKRHGEAIPLLQRAIAVASSTTTNPLTDARIVVGQLSLRLANSFAAIHQWTSAQDALQRALDSGVSADPAFIELVRKNAALQP